MSAVSNLTYIWFQDLDTTTPDKDSTPVAFSNYNEAMSYGKWVSLNDQLNNVAVYIWNYNGGSGFWSQGSFYPLVNRNWP